LESFLGGTRKRKRYQKLKRKRYELYRVERLEQRTVADN